MIREVKGTDFVLGSFVDAISPQVQQAAGVRCVLKCTDQLLNGRSEWRCDFHHPNGYFNLPFSDDGNCPVDPGQNAFLLARDWMKGAEGIIKAEGKGKIMIHSWRGTGKAVRLLAAYLCGWVRSQYRESLQRVYALADIPKTIRVDLPAFEAALLDTMVEDPVETKPATKAEGKPVTKRKSGGRKRKPRPPKLDA